MPLSAAAKKEMHKRLDRLTLLILALIIVAGAVFRLYGLDWGIPKAPYYRNLYPDEAFSLSIILKMQPPDFNPHYFINPTLHYYTLFLSIKIASLAGYIGDFSPPVECNKIAQPLEKVKLGDNAKIYRIGRFVSFLQSVLSLLLVFLIGKNLFNKKIGLTAAAFTAALPTIIYQSHFLVVDIAAVFWFTLALWYFTRKTPHRILAWSIVCGVLSGLAIGTKYTNAILAIPFVFRLLTLPTERHELRYRLSPLKYLPFFLASALAVFIITTPYSVIALNEFLNGNVEGFGGIFGPRGLFFYNNYPPNLLKPFMLATYHSLRLPLMLLSMFSLGYLFYRRRHGDMMLLSVIVPFYLMHIIHASPQHRHVLLVLPLLMIAVGRTFHDIYGHLTSKHLKCLSLTIISAVFIYTMLFSIAYIGRMTPDDTRLQCTEWVRKNLAPRTSMGAANYAPLTYTPPIDMTDILLSPGDFGWPNKDLFLMVRDILLSDYDYGLLLELAPEYFFITETEYHETPYTTLSKSSCMHFFDQLFSEKDYLLFKKFHRDFKVLGLDLKPHFPNMEWNLVNQTIWVFKARKKH